MSTGIRAHFDARSSIATTKPKPAAPAPIATEHSSDADILPITFVPWNESPKKCFSYASERAAAEGEEEPVERYADELFRSTIDVGDVVEEGCGCDE